MEEKYFEKQIGWYRMTSKHLSAGSIFIQAGQTLDCFWYVAEGTLQAEYSGGFITLEKGDIQPGHPLAHLQGDVRMFRRPLWFSGCPYPDKILRGTPRQPDAGRPVDEPLCPETFK